MFAVFTDIPLTDKGKVMVREYYNTGNAHQIYSELVVHAAASTKASIESAQLLNYMASAKLGDGTWTGSTEGFIIDWQEQIQKYDDLIKTITFSDPIKRVMLENAVNGIDDLRAVKTQEEQFSCQQNRQLTYDEYCTLLLSAAQSYDFIFSTRENSRGVQILYINTLFMTRSMMT